MTLMCSLLLCNVARVDAKSTRSELKDYNGSVSVIFSDHDSYGSYTGQIFLSGGVNKNLKVTVEGYYFRNSLDRIYRKNSINYNTDYSHTGYSVVAGGKSLTYPLCTTGYPCKAIAAVNGVYQGKAQLYSYS